MDHEKELLRSLGILHKSEETLYISRKARPTSHNSVSPSAAHGKPATL